MGNFMRHPGRMQSKHRRHFRRVALVAAMVGLGLGFVSCGVSTPKLTVPISSWPGYEYFYLAHQLGLDRAQGIEIVSPYRWLIAFEISGSAFVKSETEAQVLV